MSKDGKVVARINEVRVMRALSRFGWLRTRDIAALCWCKWLARPEGTYNLVAMKMTASGLRMSQRTMARLRVKRCVISAKAPDGSIVYTLSEKGSRVLKALGVEAVSGKDLVRGFSSAFFRHRCISNEIAISALVQGLRVSTEREVAKGLWLGGSTGVFGKRPDVVVRAGRDLTFVEVERSRKNKVEYLFLISWLSKLLALQASSSGIVHLPQDLCLTRVIFVCTKAFKARVQKSLVQAGYEIDRQKHFIHYSTELYHFEDTLFP